MCVYKRNRVYWYRFRWNGEYIQQSTRQGNWKTAKLLESQRRVALARGDAGLTERKAAPALKAFITDRLEPWAKATFEVTSPKTWLWYRTGLRNITAFESLADKKLDGITTESVAAFVGHLQGQEKKLQVSSINSALQVLRRCLRLAVEWEVIQSAPLVKLLRGARKRERVITPEEELRYLNAAPEPLGSISAVLVDSGMRPEECFRLRWESVSWDNGRSGTFLVTHGKTAAARRMLPMTPRVRSILENIWNAADKPDYGWVWPAPTKSGHIEPFSIKKAHRRTFQLVAEEAEKNNRKPIRPFVLYSLRHTFLTRLGQSGCDVWTLARVAGHSSIQMSNRYVHPSEHSVIEAMTRLFPATAQTVVPNQNQLPS